MITGVTAVPTNKNPILPPGTNKSLGKNDFLKLMVAQLKAQDPTNPMDAQDFSAQLAQFSSLEQQVATNKTLEKISNNQEALNNSSIIDLIGKSINSSGNAVQLTQGQAQTLSYELPEDASSISIDIFDSIGNKVTTITSGAQSAGNNEFQFSGVDGKGNAVPGGIYTFQVKGTNAAGKVFNGKTLTSGKVTEVVFENGIGFAIVNGNKIPASEISRVGLIS